MTYFQNRTHAGQLLANVLLNYKDKPETVVVALPRGGVPIGYEIARALHLPLEVCIIRKLGFPGRKEVAVGAIGKGVEVLYPDISPHAIALVKKEEIQELHRREMLYQGNRYPPNFGQKTVILVDDGIATGCTMQAALLFLEKHYPKKVVIAVPIAPPELYQWFGQKVAEVVCLVTPPQLRAISLWYEDFSQVSDEQVCALLQSLRN